MPITARPSLPMAGSLPRHAASSSSLTGLESAKAKADDDAREDVALVGGPSQYSSDLEGVAFEIEATSLDQPTGARLPLGSFHRP